MTFKIIIQRCITYISSGLEGEKNINKNPSKIHASK